MRILLTGTFDPAFNRNRRIRSFLTASGHEVAACNVDVWSGDRAGLMRGRRTRVALRCLAAYPMLIARLLLGRSADVVVVVYPGWLDMLLLAPVAKLRRIPVLFDPFISLSDTVVADRGLVPGDGVVYRLLRNVDRLSIRRADRVIADTPQHADFFAALGDIDRIRIGVLEVGADDGVFVPRPVSEARASRVLFYGTYIPLHGVGTIVAAAALLGDADVEVRLVGDGQERELVEQSARELGLSNIEFVPPIPLVELVDEIGAATVCLGIFGTSEKAMRVVPNKLFECVAVGRPVITGDTPAVRGAFPDGCLSLVPPGDPVALAAAIRQLLGDPDRRMGMVVRARDHYVANYSGERLRHRLEDELGRVQRRSRRFGRRSSDRTARS